MASSDGNHLNVEGFLDYLFGNRVRTGPIPHPELVTPCVPHTVAGAFEHNLVRQFVNTVNQPAPLQFAEGGFKMNLFFLPLGMTKACEQRFAVKDYRRIGREH